MSLSFLMIIPAILLIAVLAYSLKEHRPIVAAVGTTVTIILVGSVLAPILSDASAAEGIVFDDYIEIDDDSSVSGSIELVTIGEHTYAHANDTGIGTINGKKYNVQKAPLDVFLIMGQSNAAYSYYDVSAASPVAPLGTIYYFGTDTQVNTQSVTGIGMFDAIDPESGDARIGHLEMPFMTEYYAQTGHKVYTINTGWNGASISLLTVGGSHYNYEWRIARTGFSMIDQDHYNVSTVGYLWLQGESDAGLGTSVEAYKSDFLALYDAISWQSSTKFTPLFKMDNAFIVQTRTERGTNVAEALSELADENQGIYMATDITLTFTVDNGMMRADDLHYTQAAYNIIGVAVAQYIADLHLH